MPEIINSDGLMGFLKKRIVAEMTEAAEPVIQKAIQEAEKEMRKRLAITLLALMEESYDMRRMGRDLIITVKFGKE